MKKDNTHRDHNKRLCHAGGLAILLIVASGCAYEWVSTQSEIERYELDSAKKICRRWAQKQESEEERRFRTQTPTSSTRSYQSYFTECMKKHGWTRVRAAQAEPAEQPEALDP